VALVSSDRLLNAFSSEQAKNVVDQRGIRPLRHRQPGWEPIAVGALSFETVFRSDQSASIAASQGVNLYLFIANSLCATRPSFEEFLTDAAAAT
jgi:hypothetical protein